ncbi:hypothetical protein Q0590_10765 [Rhodocytophaga aerolata]|uniref:Uncharacterized protein n=1 Tax=Rhodocytophaga aerolata TaxID=455078 RepID=A0ABT8R3Q4_9BACT|nr:hypothetical protein [Rhodocytophaga aerolata]MDO1446736.1 hypothetical protein [Rhodocytophaga aerolata]
MKVRILGNSIRFRLKKPEVSQFEQVGKVTETAEFGPEPADQLRFSLETYDGETLAIRFISNTTTIYVPQALALNWTQTEKVGFDGEVDTGKGRTIRILVEKDFMCIDGNEEDNAGAYPNPMTKC